MCFGEMCQSWMLLSRSKLDLVTAHGGRMVVRGKRPRLCRSGRSFWLSRMRPGGALLSFANVCHFLQLSFLDERTI